LLITKTPFLWEFDNNTKTLKTSEMLSLTRY